MQHLRLKQLLGWVILLGALSGCAKSLTPAPALIVVPSTVEPLRETAVTATGRSALSTPMPSSQPTPTPPTQQSESRQTAVKAEPTATAAATTISLPSPPSFSTVPNDQVAASALSLGVPFTQMQPANTGIRQYDEYLFFHPIALAVYQNHAYMLDAGRVLVFDLLTATPPRVLLAPGDWVADVMVLEPLDLAVFEEGLLVLDRAGDVYLYAWQTGSWQLDRYDRPADESSSHYVVAVAGEANGRYLLETNYQYVQLYGDAVRNRLWPIVESRAVDVAVRDEDVFVLTQSRDGPTGRLIKYRDTVYVGAFRPSVTIEQPRQVAVGETAVYLLDFAGQRLLLLDRETGELLHVYQTPPGTTAVAVDDLTGGWMLAAPNRLFYNNQPHIQEQIQGGLVLPFTPLSPKAWQDALEDFSLPIQSTALTPRDYQMPGAPRHYRLGVHQGLDFYWRRGTAVVAAADGMVIRAMHDYQPLTREQHEKLAEQTEQLGYTSRTTIDFYRGRQVWVQHKNGIVSRYIHLSGIEPDIVEGATVTKGQLIGAVGNSGSPSSVRSQYADSHLHFELWLDNVYLGQFFRPIETRLLLESLFWRDD